jgi:DNA repair protein RadC
MIALNEFERSPKLSELKVSYRRNERRKRLEPCVPGLRMPQTAEAYLRSIWNKDRIDLLEEFVVVFMNNSLVPTGWLRVASGGLNFASVDPKLVFGPALQTASSAILIAHNHPSGNLEPSAHDLELTRVLKEGARLLQIRLLDHIILTREGAMSFEERGLL